MIYIIPLDFSAGFFLLSDFRKEPSLFLHDRIRIYLSIVESVYKINTIS